MRTTFQILTGKLAIACFAGGVCCSAGAYGQQLQPMPTAAPPATESATESSEENGEFLPPIVRAADMRSTAPAEEGLPPVVSAPAIVKPAPTTAPPMAVQGPPRGANFPSDARERIARFIAESNQPQAPMAMAPETPLAMPPAMSQGMPQGMPQDFAQEMPPEVQQTAWAQQYQNSIGPSVPPIIQQGSPSDVPIISPPRGEMVFEAPVVNAPSNAESSWTPDAFATGGEEPGYAGGPAPVYADPYPDHAVGQHRYFDQGYGDGSGAYQSDWEIANTDYGDCHELFSCCGFVCDASGYLIVDALYWTREDGTFTAGNFQNVDDFDWNWGGRITLGRRRDCTRGWEASYMQFDPWLAVNSQRDPAGRLQGALFGSATGGLGPATVTAFSNSTFLEQFHKTDLNSAEINKTWWGADVAKAFLGARFIYLDDEFHLSSANRFGEQGIHTIDATNNMFGVHAGTEVLYDIGYRLSFSWGAKIGGYVNFFDGSQTLLNDGTFHVFNSDEETDFSASAEMGAYARFRISPNCRVRAGYEFLALLDIYDVESNYRTVILPQAGLDWRDGGALFHGASVGIEFYR